MRGPIIVVSFIVVSLVSIIVETKLPGDGMMCMAAFFQQGNQALSGVQIGALYTGVRGHMGIPTLLKRRNGRILKSTSLSPEHSVQ